MVHHGVSLRCEKITLISVSKGRPAAYITTRAKRSLDKTRLFGKLLQIPGGGPLKAIGRKAGRKVVVRPGL